jgi:hypothetical protein
MDISTSSKTTDVDSVEAVASGIKDLERIFYRGMLKLLTKVNGKSEKPEKGEDDDSGDEVEEPNGTARTLPTLLS